LNNWGIGLEIVYPRDLLVTAYAEACLERLQTTVWISFALESSGAGEKIEARFTAYNIPGSELLQRVDLFLHPSLARNLHCRHSSWLVAK
jgi:hypothetical protein